VRANSGSAGTAPTLTTTASKTNYLRFMYNAADTKWDLISSALNYLISSFALIDQLDHRAPDGDRYLG
jgi:hypothetical protein